MSRDTVQQAIDSERVQHLAWAEAEVVGFVRLLAAGLMDDPLEKVTSVWDRDVLRVNTHPTPLEASTLIGAKGKMFHSFKVVIEHYCRRLGIKVVYRVENTEQRGPGKNIVFNPRDDWDAPAHCALFKKHCEALFEPGFELRSSDCARGKTQFFLELSPSEPEWSPELQVSLGFIWHACTFRKGRMVFLERMRRRHT